MNYREAIQARSTFDYLHRKQSGGQVRAPLIRQQSLATIGGVCIQFPPFKLFELVDGRHVKMSHTGSTLICSLC